MIQKPSFASSSRGEIPASGKPLDEATLAAGQRAAARAVLSVMPAYDRLAKELED